jgi:hypothetical protein
LYGLTTLFSLKIKVKPGQAPNGGGFSGNRKESFCNWASLAFAAWQAKGHVRLERHLFQGCGKGSCLPCGTGLHLLYDHDGGRALHGRLPDLKNRQEKIAADMRSDDIGRIVYLGSYFPYLIPSTIAFMIVGLGVSSIVPTVYSVAGSHSKVHAGIALATVSSVSFLGFLMGPPLIGYISELAGLRTSFAVVGVFGIGISIMVSRMEAFQQFPDPRRVRAKQEAVAGDIG